MDVIYNAGGEALAAYLSDCEQRYSSEHKMIGRTWSSPGYHTQYPEGAWAHPTRDSMTYALALLRADRLQDSETACNVTLSPVESEVRATRAAEVIGKVLTLQETKPTAATYGIWPWVLEEPLSEMAPPDWNWADFIGALLAQMLAQHPTQLPDDLLSAMRASLGHAASAIFRRNVAPSYTNIAVLGGFVTAAAGELLEASWLLDYGRQRLADVVASAEYHGGFNEYNSPTYTLVVLHSCERALQLLQDQSARAHAEALRELAWRTIAEHFHPPTAQWSGPHSRAYRDRLDPATHQILRLGAGLMEDDGSLLWLVDPLPCPPALAERFRVLPAPETEVVRAFIRRPEAWASRTGTTWLADGAALGTVDYEDFWTQRRPLIGYWRVLAEAPAVLRLRFLHDGRDFASACGQHAQADNRVLTGFGLLTNRGDWHLHLDRPDDGLFYVSDLRVRYELDAQDARVRQMSSDRFEMVAGDYRAVIHVFPGTFDGRPVSWTCGMVGGKAVVDGICYQGDPVAFDPAAVTQINLGVALELLRPGEHEVDLGPVWHSATDETLKLAWPAAGLRLTVPLYPHPSR